MAGIAVGCKGRSELVVTREDSAKMMGSGALMVFSTPSMVALMENAACNALEPMLPEGSASVGAQMNVQHTSATPVGMRVYAEATLTSVEVNAFTFDIQAFDERGPIGKATHRRVAVYTERFLRKVQEKLG